MPPMSLSTRPAEMVHVVEADVVAFGIALGVAPAPADGDAGVEKVGDLVVRDGVVGALADPDADGLGVNPAAGADDVVVDGDVAGAGRLVRPIAPSPMRTPPAPRSCR